jgi:hypothetical protein
MFQIEIAHSNKIHICIKCQSFTEMGSSLGVTKLMTGWPENLCSIPRRDGNSSVHQNSDQAWVPSSALSKAYWRPFAQEKGAAVSY